MLPMILFTESATVTQTHTHKHILCCHERKFFYGWIMLYIWCQNIFSHILLRKSWIVHEDFCGVREEVSLTILHINTTHRGRFSFVWKLNQIQKLFRWKAWTTIYKDHDFINLDYHLNLIIMYLCIVIFEVDVILLYNQWINFDFKKNYEWSKNTY